MDLRRTSSCVLLLLSVCARPHAAPAAAKPLRPFLCRDAVVRESADRVVLVGGREDAKPIIVTGAAPPGLRMSADNRDLATASKVLSEYVEKITGAACAVTTVQDGGGLLGDGSFEGPPMPDTPENTRGPLAGSLSGWWTIYHNTIAEASVFLDTANAHHGKVSMSVKGVTRLSGVIRKLDLKQGARYKLSLWYRTQTASGYAHCGIPHIASPVRERLPAAPNWTPFTTEFVADNPRGNWLQLILGLESGGDKEGQVWFDGIRVEEAADTVAAAATPDAWRIHVGAQGDPVTAFPELKTADGHGFVIATRERSLHLVGRTGIGTLYAVWFFLQNYAGLRIVGPGEMGEVYPTLDTLSVPRELYVLNPGPDYLLRIWSQRDFNQAAWLQDRGGDLRFDFHHAGCRIFPPGKYGTTHPEYYPVWDGTRHIPLPLQRSHWQPTYSEPAVAQRAIEYADSHFTWRPDLRSISLTVNDGAGFSDLDKAEDGSVVETYYRYVNSVARGIRPQWPDRYVAFISYAQVKDPPSFKLEDNVMLFLMSFEGNIKSVYDTWQGKVSNFGVYQWLYGAGWVIPNHWPHGIQDYLRWLRSVGGKAFKGEACIGFSQGGPKMWVLANLLWNVDADVDALLLDYYEHAYGKDAAPPVARYFAQAEQMYERRRTPEDFNIVRLHPGPYQFKLVEEDDFATMATALAEAQRLVRGEANATRLDWTTRCFELGRRYWNAHKAFANTSSLSAKGLTDEAERNAFVESVAAFYRAREDADAYREQQCVPVPLGYCVAPSRDNPPIGMWTWLDTGFREWCDDTPIVTSFSAVTAKLREGMSAEQVAGTWRQLGQANPYARAYTDHQQYLLLHANQPLTNVLSNGSFEQPPQPDDPRQKQLLADGQAKTYHYVDANDYTVSGLCARDWVTFQRAVRSYAAELDTTGTRDGKVGLCLSGVGRYGGVMHDVTAPNPRARYRLSLWYRTSETFRSGSVGIAFYGLRSLPRQHIGLATSATWIRKQLEFTSNYPAEQARFTIALMFHRGTSADAKVWFDDVRLEMLSPAGVATR